MLTYQQYQTHYIQVAPPFHVAQSFYVESTPIALDGIKPFDNPLKEFSLHQTYFVGHHSLHGTIDV